MRIRIVAIGKLLRGPEFDLVKNYINRARRLGTQLGFQSIEIIELPSAGEPSNEAKKLRKAIPANAKVIRLDEGGTVWRSISFSQYLARMRDEGVSELCFIIGGADGFDKQFSADYPDSMCLGVLTWPHKLVRVMLTEQIYRAFSLIAGTPYHRN